MKINKYKLKRSLISFFYPNRCPFCGEVIESDKYLCGNCNDILIEYPYNPDELYCCYFNEKSTRFIYSMKDYGNGYAISLAAKLLNDRLEKIGILKSCDLIIPVPSSKSGMKQRGYSCPLMMAKEISELSGVKYSNKCLIKIKETTEQKQLSRSERAINLEGCFAKGTVPVNGLNILVVDDVSTTGATLLEMEKVLKSMNAGKIFLSAFAKTPLGTVQ